MTYEDAHYDEGYRDGMQKMREVGHARIKELEAKLAECEARLGKAMELLTLCRDMFNEVAHPSDPLSVMLNQTLAEIKGESHD